jgi:hypothetical protein
MWIVHISVDLEVYRLHHSEDAAQRCGSCCCCSYKINVPQPNCLFDWILRVKDPVTSSISIIHQMQIHAIIIMKSNKNTPTKSFGIT